MTQFLVTEENPSGFKLEDILSAIRKDMVLRATKIVDDDRPQAKTVLENNIRILGLLSECINIATDSTRLLDKAFGPHKDGEPRIGVS
ncbi:MAG: hypothetical protein MI920_38965 [Kiloniellales bacterium]|nr:hypothetical protein [Kiloniellales bacterium]